MFSELKALKKEEYTAYGVASDYDSVKEKVISIYKNIKQTEDEITESTELDLTDDEMKQFRSEVCGTFNIDCSEEEYDEFGSTIGEVISFVMDHQGSSVETLLSQTWDSKAFEDVRKKLDTTLRMLDGYGVSQEGIGVGLLKVFIGTTDLFLKVGNTFKTNIMKFYKSLKRSEIRFYWESHMLLCKTVESQPITKFMSVPVPIPTGMVSGYNDAIEYVDNVFKCVDLKNYADAIYKELQDIRRQMTRSQQNYKQGFKGTATSAKLREETVRKFIAEQTKYFSDKQIGTMPFNKAFASMQDLNTCRGKLLDMEKYLGQTDDMVKLVDNIDVIIGDITGYLSEDSEVDKAFIEQLAHTIRFLATAFDIYGTYAMRQMALEHNLVLTYETLYKKI